MGGNFKKAEWPPFAEWKWRSYDGRRSVSVEEFVERNSECMFFIGTDSQNYSKKNTCVFTTVLIAYKMHRGGTIITHKTRASYMDALRQRLLMEAMLSLEVGWYLDQKIDKDNIMGIHLDVNRNLRYKSGQYKDELVGMVMAQGFNALVKPDAWAASSVADSRC
jgi:hypothetical protein